MSPSKETTGKRLQRLRVPLGFLMAILFLVFSHPGWRSMAIGVPIALIGVGIRAWASGHLRKNTRLTVTGPYSYTRNPLYLGSFLLAIGVVVCGGVWWLGVLLLGFFFAVYLPVMQAEVGEMLKLFPDEFPEYQANVPIFFPRFTPWRHQSASFDTSLYLKYREYRALIGLMVVLAALIVRILLTHQ